MSAEKLPAIRAKKEEALSPGLVLMTRTVGMAHFEELQEFHSIRSADYVNMI